MRKRISLLLKAVTVCCVAVGVTMQLHSAVRDGYSHWTRRLIYFTTLSNLWIAAVCLALIVVSLFFSQRKKHLYRLYVLRFVFTVSIVITGIVFCGLLAPFADKVYHVWSAGSMLTHAAVPVLATADYFVDGQGERLRARHVWYALIPPLAYFTVAGVMTACAFDFGHGYTYPYFFMNFRSPAGWFGFSRQPPVMGTGYWMIAFSLLVCGVAAALMLVRRAIRKKA